MTSIQATRTCSNQEVTSPCASLRRILDLNSWLDVPRAAEIALGVLEALGDARRRGAPRVGLQPENIFITVTGKVFLNEALARIAAQYLSPEEARGEPGDARSDLYGLGVVLYEMLTDRVPFDGKHAIIKHKHLYRSPEPPHIFRSDLPQALSQLVMRLLEKDPACRSSHSELSGELRRIIAPQSADGSDPSFDGPSSEIIGNSDLLDADEMISDMILADWPPTVSVECAAEENELTAHPEREKNADILDSEVLENEPFEPAFAATPTGNPSKEKPAILVTGQAGPLIISSPLSMQRDPFDLPVVIAEELPARQSSAQRLLNLLRQFAGSMKWRKGSFKTVRAYPTRQRVLTVVLSGILVCATLQLYELNEMSSPKSREGAASSTSASSLLPSHVGHQPGTASSATQAPARTVTALKAASSARAASAHRRDTTGRNSIRPSRSSSPRQDQRDDARRYRYVGTRAGGKPTARAVHHKNDNRRDKASPPVRKKRGSMRRVLLMPGRH